MYLKNAVSCFWIFSFTFMNWYLHPFLLSSLFICWKFSSGIFAKASGKFVPMFSQTLVLHCCKFFCSVIDVCLQWLYNRTCTFQCFGFNLSCEWWVWFRFCNKKPGLDRKIGLDISYILYLISYSTSSAVGKTMLSLSCYRKIVPVHTRKCLQIFSLLWRLPDIPHPDLWLPILKFCYINIKFPTCLTDGIIEAFVLIVVQMIAIFLISFTFFF